MWRKKQKKRNNWLANDIFKEWHMYEIGNLYDVCNYWAGGGILGEIGAYYYTVTVGDKGKLLLRSSGKVFIIPICCAMMQ